MKITKKIAVREVIERLQVGESFHKKEFIDSIWGYSDYFTDRSFDVIFFNTKKLFQEREFSTNKGRIVRVK